MNDADPPKTPRPLNGPPAATYQGNDEAPCDETRRDSEDPDRPLDIEDPEENAAIAARVERALHLTRHLRTAEEVEDHRRMLTCLARTTPARLERLRPRPAPDQSGTREKPGASALWDAIRGASRGKASGT